MGFSGPQNTISRFVFGFGTVLKPKKIKIFKDGFQVLEVVYDVARVLLSRNIPHLLFAEGFNYFKKFSKITKN
jgi:hypothetical protein